MKKSAIIICFILAVAFVFPQLCFADTSAKAVSTSSDATKIINASIDTAKIANTSTAKSALLMEYDTGEILYARNETDARPIASMVKIMTLLCIYDSVEEGKISLDDEVHVSDRAASMGGSQVFLDANTTHKAENLIKSIIICSANDSCVAMAEHICGSVEIFVEKMNQKSKELGLVNTFFVNCTGLPAINQFSCAIDVANMFRALVKHDNFFVHSRIWMEDYVHPDGRITGMTNTNKLSRFYDGCDGGKTGFTAEAMHCLCATAKRGDTRYISVVIGASDSKKRFAEVSEMFNYAFANYENKVLLDVDTVSETPIKNGKTDTVKYAPSKKLVCFGKRGTVEAEMSLELFEVKAPITAGDVVGKAYAISNGVTVGECDLVATENVEKKGYWDYLLDIIG